MSKNFKMFKVTNKLTGELWTPKEMKAKRGCNHKLMLTENGKIAVVFEDCEYEIEYLNNDWKLTFI